MMSVNDKNDYHKVIREMIKNENELRSSRNNWFVAIQSFLFTVVCEICLKDSYSICCSSCNDITTTNKYFLISLQEEQHIE